MITKRRIIPGRIIPRRFIPILIVGIIPACSTIQYHEDSRANAAHVRHTSNSEATRGCEFVASAEHGEETVAEIVGPTADPHQYLVYVPAGGGVWEVYACR